MKVKRLLPTAASGVVAPVKTAWLVAKKGGATETMLSQKGTRAPLVSVTLPVFRRGWFTPRR